jgi:hypothetical protein
MLFFVRYKTKTGAKRTRYFIDPIQAMRLEKELSSKNGVTVIELGKA